MDTEAVAVALEEVTGQLPGGGERRPGQEAMARAVAEVIDADGLLSVQAGTGTGKTLAYLVPALLAGRRTIVATATKALQDQLAGSDLPFLAEHLGEHLDEPVTWAVLFKAQKAINLSQGDEHGLLNNRLTLANGIWILLGISLWALILLGLASGYFPEQTDTFLSSLIETVS